MAMCKNKLLNGPLDLNPHPTVALPNKKSRFQNSEVETGLLSDTHAVGPPAPLLQLRNDIAMKKIVTAAHLHPVA